MYGKIINLWSDVIEIEFDKSNLPEVNHLLTLHNDQTYLLVKRVLNETTVRAIIIYNSEEISINDQVKNTKKVLWFQ